MTAAKKRENMKRWHIRKNLPHQVALPNDLCCMENYDLIAVFCRQFETEPMLQHVMAKWPDGKSDDYRPYCFATREDAEVFAEHFEGTHFDPVRIAKRVGSTALGYEPTSGSRSSGVAPWSYRGSSASMDVNGGHRAS